MDISYAQSVKMYYRSSLLSVPGVRGLATTMEGDTPVIVAYTSGTIPNLPATIEGIPVRYKVRKPLTQFGDKVQFSAMMPTAEQMATDTERYARFLKQRPIYAGIQIAAMVPSEGYVAYVGTLGLILHNVIINGVAQDCILTNRHVAKYSYQGYEFYQITQPAVMNNPENIANRIGEFLVGYNGEDGALYVDTDWAICKLEPGILTSDAGERLTIAGTARFGDCLAPPAIGTPVFKTGRTSAVSRGLVASLDYEDDIYDDYGNIIYHFTDSILINPVPFNEPFGLPGDSGSAIYTDNSMIGLLFAGNGVDETAVCKNQNILKNCPVDMHLENATFSLKADPHIPQFFSITFLIPTEIDCVRPCFWSRQKTHLYHTGLDEKIESYGDFPNVGIFEFPYQGGWEMIESYYWGGMTYMTVPMIVGPDGTLGILVMHMEGQFEESTGGMVPVDRNLVGSIQLNNVEIYQDKPFFSFTESGFVMNSFTNGPIPGENTLIVKDKAGNTIYNETMTLDRYRGFVRYIDGSTPNPAVKTRLAVHVYPMGLQAKVTATGVQLPVGSGLKMVVPPGQVTYSVSAPGCSTVTKTITIAEGHDVEEYVTLSVDPNMPGSLMITIMEGKDHYSWVNVKNSAGEVIWDDWAGPFLAGVPADDYVVDITTQGGVKKTFNVSVEPHSTNYYFIDMLQPLPATAGILVDLKPNNATVSISGIAQPIPNLTKVDLPPGTITYTISATGYQSKTGTMTLSEGQKQFLNEYLVPNDEPITDSYLKINADPEDSTININHKLATNHTAVPVPSNVAVPYSVTKSGFTPKEGTETVGSGQTKELFITLTQGPTPPPPPNNWKKWAIIGGIGVAAVGGTVLLLRD